MKDRKIVVPGIYRHFKHTEDGIPNNYMYCIMFVAKAVDKKVIQEFCERFKTKVLPIIWVKYTEKKDKRIPLFLIDGEYKFWNDDCNQDLLVYKSLYDGEQPYARPYDMFMSEVDHEKYPNVKQKYRFEYTGGIQLKNLDLSNIALDDAYYTAVEENESFTGAIDTITEIMVLNGYLKEYIKEFYIERILDQLQANINLASFYGITADDIMKYYNTEYLDKLDKKGRK